MRELGGYLLILVLCTTLTMGIFALVVEMVFELGGLN